MANQIDPALAQAIADLNFQLQRLGVTLQSTASTAGQASAALNSNIKSVGAGMARLRFDLDRGRTSYAESMRTFRQLKDDFEDLDDATRQSAAGQRIRRQQEQISSELFRNAIGELTGDVIKIGLAGALNYYKNQLIVGVRSLQDNVGGIQTAFALQKQSVEDSYKVLSQLGQAVGAAGAGIAFMNPVIGGLTAAFGGGIDAAAKFFGGLQSFSLDVLSKETVKTVESFKLVTAAGALFADGMSEMREQARLAFLDLGDYAKIVSANSESLAKLGGTVGQGTKRFTEINRELLYYRAELLNLGITTTDQAQAVIDYSTMLQETGQLQGRNATELAARTADYLTNLKAITAITGEEARKAQERARAASLQAAVNNKLNLAGGEAADKFRQVVTQFPGLEKAVQQLYTIGSVTDPIMAQFLATQPALDAALRRQVATIDDQSINIKDQQRNYELSMREQGAIIRDQTRQVQGTVGLVNVAGGGLQELSDLTTRYAIFAEQIVSKGSQLAIDQANNLRKTEDPLTNTINKTEVLFTQLGVVLSSILDGPLKAFADKAPSVIEEAAKKMLDAVKPLGELSSRVLIFDRMIDEKITSIFRRILAEQIRVQNIPVGDVGAQYARGGVVESPTRALIGEAGPEAVIPLSNNRAVPVEFKYDSNLYARQFNENFQLSLAALQRNAQQNQLIPISPGPDNTVVAQTLDAVLTGPGGVRSVFVDLKNQLANDNKEQLNMLQMQVDKMDRLVTAMQDNVRASENIANALG